MKLYRKSQKHRTNEDSWVGRNFKNLKQVHLPLKHYFGSQKHTLFNIFLFYKIKQTSSFSICCFYKTLTDIISSLTLHYIYINQAKF